MRVLQVNKFLYRKGGAEIVCLGLGDALRAAGHEVCYFGMDDPRNVATDDADLYPATVDYHARRGALRKAREAMRTIYGVQARRGMAALLDRRRPAIVHAHNIYHQLTPSILAPARDRGIPVLLTLHDLKLQCPVYLFLRDGKLCEECLGRMPWPVLAHRCKDGGLAESAVLFAEAALHRLLGSYARGVTLFTAPSVFLREKMIAGGVPAERIVHLPNALPFGEDVLAAPYAPPPRRDRPRLFWAGRVSPEKGLGTLLRAVARCDAPVELQLAGDGPADAALRALADELGLRDRVEWLGRLPRGDIAARVREADGCIVPSECYENAPLSVLESMALGRAPLVSDLGGLPELVDDDSGWRFSAGDPAALAACLAAWAADPSERERRGRAAHANARARFSPQVVLDQTLALYERALRNA
ncbi:MAG: glycosyltransferase [Candidatus Latescibacteria bacterium]|nr:glycosyltransferase [Candidatus Latescibacterota bacterium]